MKALGHFILAIQFLTRIHLTGKNMPCEKEDFKGAMSFFTIIGLIIGLFQYGAFCLTFYLTGEAFMSAVVTTFVGIYLTGGMHLDGLADLFDGFGAQKDREKTLEIMKDSRVGSFGVIGLLADITLHIAGIMALRSNPLWIVLVPLVGKWSVVLLCYTGTCASKGLGALWIQNISRKGVLLNTLVVIGIGSWILKPLDLGLLLLLALFYTLGFKKVVTQKLGGVTGDCLGAMQQLTEWLVLLLLLSFQ